MIVTVYVHTNMDSVVLGRPNQEALRPAVVLVHRAGSRVALQLGHAGRRGSMRPRSQGVDRPLGQGGWRLIAASPIAYTPHAALPREMTHRDMVHIATVFAAAARAAAGCEFGALELN